MKRLWAVLWATVATTVVAVGCGPYEARLDRTLQALKYRARLDRFLNPAPAGKFQELGIFVRPPKPQEQAKQFLLATPPEGQFDLDASFLGQQANASLAMHVLGRHPLPKKAAAKGAPPPSAPVARGSFDEAVRSLLAGVYGDAATQSQPKAINVKRNQFRRLIFSGNNNEVKIYLYNSKGSDGPYDVALIWETPANQPIALSNALDAAITLCLESFAVGRRASRAFSGDTEATEATGAGSEVPGTAF